MNKCAKFHGDSPKGKNVKFNLASAIELSETAVLCTTLCKRATSVAHLTNFSFEFFFYEIFTEDASLSLRYRSAKKSKMTKNSNQGGVLEAILVIFVRRALIFFFFLKALGKKWKMTPILCACTVVITLDWLGDAKNVAKGHLAPSNLTFLINCDRQKRFSQNERRRADLQNGASNFLIFA